jgi:hypothetical protein
MLTGFNPDQTNRWDRWEREARHKPSGFLDMVALAVVHEVG